MKFAGKERDLLMRLLQESASLGQVRALLKDRGLPFSAGTWDEMKEKRLAPALKDGRIGDRDLLELIRTTEEHGNQHVFLYKSTPETAAELVGEGRVRDELRRLKKEGLVNAPLLLDRPKEPTLVEVRWEKEKGAPPFAVKTVEERIEREFLGEERHGTFIDRRYQEQRVRAVNVFKVHADGFLELRVQSHVNTSEYGDDVAAQWALVAPLLLRERFEEVYLTRAKQVLWEQRAALAAIVRHSGARFRNARATVLSAATGGAAAGLSDDADAATSLDLFHGHDAICEAENIWWLQNGGSPSREIHCILSGRPNEFAIPAKCSEEDYEYVVQQLRRLNQ